jgi:hypothetical protein
VITYPALKDKLIMQLTSTKTEARWADSQFNKNKFLTFALFPQIHTYKHLPTMQIKLQKQGVESIFFILAKNVRNKAIPRQNSSEITK